MLTATLFLLLKSLFVSYVSFSEEEATRNIDVTGCSSHHPRSISFYFTDADISDCTCSISISPDRRINYYVLAPKLQFLT